MAKSKKSKILAMALCASVMAGIYAAPVMAAAIDVSDTSTLEVDGTKYTITSGTLNLDGGDILDSLKGKTLDFGYGSHIYTDSIHTGSYININQTYLRADPNNRNALIIGGTIDGYGVVKGGTTFDFLETNNKLAKISYDPDSNTTNFASRIHTNGSVTANAGFTANGGSYYAIRGTNNQYTMLANEKYFALGSGGLLKGPEGSDNYNTTKERATFYVDNATGDVTTKGTFSAANGAFDVDTNGNVTANRVTVGNTVVTGSSVTTNYLLADEGEIGSVMISGGLVDGVDVSSLGQAFDSEIGVIGGITRTDENNDGILDTTTIEGSTSFDANGMNVGNGAVVANTDGSFSAANGAFDVDTNGNVAANRVTVGNTVVTGSSVTTNYLLADEGEIGSVMISGGLVDGVDVSSLGQAFDSEIGVIGGITRTDENNDGILDTTTIEGSTSFDANGMNIGNGAVVANTDGSFSAGNGAFDVDTKGNVTANRVTVGNTVVTGTSVTTDVIYADEGQIGGTLIQGGFVNADNVFSANYNLEEVGDNLADLTGSVGNIGDNVAGITREAEDGALPGEGTTTIEDTLSVSGDSVLAQVGSSQLVITEDVAGLSSGNASFALSNNELQLSVAGNGLLVNQFGTNLNGTVNFIGHDGNSYTLANLEGRVYDLEQKTQNITSAEPGQGGSSEVPPTGDGHTGFEGDVTVGGDINADAGNFNKVNTDEITVGNSTFIDGDSVNSNEGNFKDKVTVGGEGGTSITGDGMTVGTADKGTTVSDSGVSIKNEYGSVETGVVDGKNDVVVTDEDGNRTSLVDTAGRVDNLEQGVAELNNRVGELEDRIDKVGAMAAAIANLRTMGYDPAAPTEVAVGIGQYRDETGAALGLFHYPNRDFMLSLSVSTSGDEVMGGIGATWKFGRKSPEKVAEIKKAQAEADARRAEEAKLAKAEEMKQAAKEAKIKAQQERHAKLAAERAAQAEAAK